MSASESPCSPLFSSPDADLELLSSDKVLFKVHRKNLKFHSDVFAAMFSAAHADREGAAPIELSEPSAVLELLFQYMYRQPQPALRAVPFTVCAQLAEAAQKYLVYSAMPILQQKMRDNIDQEPLEVLAFALRHDLAALANDAGRKSLGIPLKKAAAVMSAEAFIKWAIFYDEWHAEARTSLQKAIRGLKCNCGVYVTSGGPDVQEAMRLLRNPSLGYERRDAGYLRGTMLNGNVNYLDRQLNPPPPTASGILRGPERDALI
ncbi:hypothetical protein MIND_01329300 [Mycena indigotica]|uniref:BTB domain-containing protein n=1 Tax=Mycena indigotica TaxID=2126181 RepID=A0A8H6VSA1_9AGAR|nr:uncharacterized protein MIND_01329300 [Mycena indigotica]KAF7290161.1 hypothetical protein MIND_01329300 [Mycena indigotica]